MARRNRPARFFALLLAATLLITGSAAASLASSAARGPHAKCKRHDRGCARDSGPRTLVIAGSGHPAFAPGGADRRHHGGSGGSPSPVGIAGSWHLVFDDEFSGSALNSSLWNTGWFGSGITGSVNPSLESDCYDPSADVVSGGILAINATAHSEFCNGTTQPYTTGLINTNGRFSFTYGAFEARIWMPGSGSTVSDWPAFWADGQNWPQTGEIDVAEGLGGQVCYHFHYSGGGPGGCGNVPGAAGGWHTYAADWEPGSITFYYDGQQVWTDTSGVTSAPMYLILGLGIPASGPASVPATFKVDYVRVWQH